MNKLVYSQEQINDLVIALNEIKITSIMDCKRVVVISNIIDAPVDVLDDKDGN